MLKKIHLLYIICIICLVSNCSQQQGLEYPVISTSTLERILLKTINRWRYDRGRQILIEKIDLQKIARDYSQDMADRSYFSHLDPEGRKIGERLLASGISFQSAAENLAKLVHGDFEPSSILQAWVASQSHRENLLDNNFSETGLGIFQNTKNEIFITQIFVEPEKRHKIK